LTVSLMPLSLARLLDQVKQARRRREPKMKGGRLFLDRLDLNFSDQWTFRCAAAAASRDGRPAAPSAAPPSTPVPASQPRRTAPLTFVTWLGWASLPQPSDVRTGQPCLGPPTRRGWASLSPRGAGMDRSRSRHGSRCKGNGPTGAAPRMRSSPRRAEAIATIGRWSPWAAGPEWRICCSRRAPCRW
jgi:hypothetical protein